MPESTGAETAKRRSWIFDLSLCASAFLFFLLVVARDMGVNTLTIFGTMLLPIPDPGELALAALIAIAVAPLALMAGARANRLVRLAGSGAIGLILAGPWILLAMVGLAAVLFPLPFLPLSRRARIAILALAMGAVMTILGIAQLGGPWWSFLGYLFSVLAGYRYILFFYEVVRKKTNWREHFLDYAFYLFSGPFFIVVPYTLVIPPYGSFRSVPSDLLRLAKRAARMELWAVINTVAFASLAELIPDAWLEIPILGVGINFTLLLLMISGAAHALSGLLCLWGHEVAEPFNWVVLSRSLAEFLNRFMPQFKDFLATVFFYPVLFRLRKIPMALSFTLALAFTLMVDNTLAHLMRYAYSVSNDALALVRMVNVFWENTSLTVAMLLWILCGRVYSRAITRHPFLAIRNKTLKAVLRVVRFGIVYFLFAHLFYFHPRS